MTDAVRTLYATGTAGRAWRIRVDSSAITYGPRGEAPAELPWSGAALRAACIDPGGIWVASDDGALYNLPSAASHPVGRCAAVASDGRGRLWISGGGKLRTRDGDAWRDLVGEEARGLVVSADGRRLYAALENRIIAFQGDAREDLLLRAGADFGPLVLTPAGLVVHAAGSGELLGVNLFHRTLTVIANGVPRLLALAFDRPGRVFVGTTGAEDVEIPSDGSGPPRKIAD